MSLLSDVSVYIRSGETITKKLGLEIEHFIIDEKGVQIDFHEISSMIKEVGEKIGAKLVYMDGYPVGYVTDEYSTSLEPACQFEISINPYSDIHEIGRIYNEFIDLWIPLFAQKKTRLHLHLRFREDEGRLHGLRGTVRVCRRPRLPSPPSDVSHHRHISVDLVHKRATFAQM